MPLGTPSMGPMPTAPWQNQKQKPPPVTNVATIGKYGGVNVAPIGAPRQTTPMAPGAPLVPYSGASAAAAAAKSLGKNQNPLQPWNTSGTFGTGAYTQAAAQQTATQALQAQLAAALGLSDAQYNSARSDNLLRQTQAQTGRDAAIAALQGDTSNALAQLAGDRYRTVDLGMQGVAADRAYNEAGLAAFNRETENLMSDVAKQREFLARAFGIETAQLDAMLGFATEGRDITNRQLDAQTGFAGERRSLSDRGSQLSYDQNTRAALSDATARGAVTSQGFADTRSELARQLGLAREGSDLDYRSTISDIGTRRANTDLGYRQTVSDVGSRRASAELGRDKGTQGLDNAIADRQVETDRFRAGYQKSMADAARQEASLASIANDYGLKEQDLRRRLEQGINNANLDYASTMAALQSGLASNDEQQRAAAAAIITSMAGA